MTYLYLYVYVRVLIAPQELLLAAKWAKLNRLPFPPIDPTVVDREGLKELYVFQDPDDPNCPVVLHFPLVNINFRNFSAPGQSVSQSVTSLCSHVCPGCGVGGDCVLGGGGGWW